MQIALGLAGNVFISGQDVLALQSVHPTDPSLLFLAILDKLVPDQIASNPHLSRSGERGTVALPEKIPKAIYGK